MSFKKLILILYTISSLIGCTTIPKVNSDWISANCSGLGYQTYDTKSYSNCTHVGIDTGVYDCKYSSGGTYVGKIKNGDHHGRGLYTWKDGTIFDGIWKNGDYWCGIWREGNKFGEIRNGIVGQTKQAGADWGTIGALALIGGLIYAAAESGYGGGSPSSGNSSPVKCSYNINNKTITVDNPNYAWGSCPSSYSYKKPLMCSDTYSYASPKCNIGKACGNTCISSSDICHIGKGSACNNVYRSYP